MSAPVPSGWTETTLGRVLQRSPSYGINAPALPRGVGKYPYLRITDIDEAGRVDIGSLPSVRDTASDTYILSEGDIVVARTGASVGKSHLFEDAGEPVVFAGFLIRLSADENAILPSYLAQLMQTAHYWDWIRENSARSGQPGVNGQQLKTIPIVLPPLPEQQAIAAALSDADGVVAGLERVIAKKRLIKQGAMQDLLTARRRLPGFSGEWEVKRLGELVTVIMGQSPSSTAYNVAGDGLPLIQGNADIKDRKAITRVFTRQVTKLGKAGDYLMTVRAPVGEIATTDIDVCLGRGVCALRTDQQIVYHIMVAKEPEWAKLSKGSTFDSVNGAEIRAFEVLFPTDTAERHAVAQVLDDMDAEIQTLESRLAKARAVKEGMMQNLLTGRVRLV